MLYSNDTTNLSEIQEDMNEVDLTKFSIHKMCAGGLGASLSRLGFDSKSERVLGCGNFLEFRIFEDGCSFLTGAIFCKVRLCPMCAWRRSLKVYAQVSKIMDYVEEHHDYRFIFVTLTQRNVKGDKLSEEINKMRDGFKKLSELKEFKDVSRGFFRTLEVTHNWKRDDYHPHIHMVMAVNKSYFNDKKYLSHKKWVELWQQCMRLDYEPTVDVRTVKKKKDAEGNDMNLRGAVAEVAKYSVKSADYIHPTDNRKTDSAVLVLDTALAHRRLFTYGGNFRKIHKKLNLDDPDGGRLTDNKIRSDLTYVIVRYRWHEGLSEYVKQKRRVAAE
jgi:plasmid rolling circle replication initiator protein Rep